MAWLLLSIHVAVIIWRDRCISVWHWPSRHAAVGLHHGRWRRLERLLRVRLRMTCDAFLNVQGFLFLLLIPALFACFKRDDPGCGKRH